MSGTMLTIVAPGVATSVRDGGRRGLAHLGRSRSGALDLSALRLANRLVGNRPDSPGLETCGGLVLRAQQPVWLAMTGSPAEVQVTSGPALGWGVATALPAGATVRVGRLHGGARVYLAVRGGVRADGSSLRATDPVVDAEPSPHVAVPPRLDRPVRLWPGPRLDWFVEGAWSTLTASDWRVTVASDRIGARLDGPRLARAHSGELPSEGLVEGALQVPPDGLPIVMLADHPVTGGYPVIAVVDPADLEVIAQAAPGTTLRFIAARRPASAARG